MCSFFFIIIALLFVGLLDADENVDRPFNEISYYKTYGKIKGESMTINSSEEEVEETMGSVQQTSEAVYVTNYRKPTKSCPPPESLYSYAYKKRVKTPLDGPFTHDKSNAAQWPHRMVGKILFTRPNGEHATCSGSVIQKRLILTAGHCAYKNGKYMTDFAFIPAFDDGSAPYGIWEFTKVWISPKWFENTVVPNEGDWSIFLVKDKFINGESRSIGDCLGWFGFSTENLIDNHVTSIGYADNFDEGNRMHQVYSQYRRTRRDNIVEYPSDMTEGTSGGPWVENFGSEGIEQNRVVGVTSYRDTNSSRRYLGSSTLNALFYRMFLAACNETDNCLLPYH